MRIAFILCLVTAVIASACTSGTGTQAPRASRDVITAEELAEFPGENAYDAIRRLRPQWLSSRSVDATQAPVVFIENVRAGDLDRLRTVMITNVAELRFIRPRDATTRWGTGYGGGVIEVIWRR